MNCQKVTPLLSEYMDGELSSRVEGLIQSHLRTCAGCRQEMEALQKTAQLVSRFEPARLSREFDARLFQRLDKLQAGHRSTAAAGKWVPARSGARVGRLPAFLSPWKLAATAGGLAAIALSAWELAPPPQPTGHYIAACIQAAQVRPPGVNVPSDHPLAELSPGADLATEATD